MKAQEARTEKNPGAEEELLQTLETSRTRQDPNVVLLGCIATKCVLVIEFGDITR